jgi:hypothetical protein
VPVLPLVNGRRWRCCSCDAAELTGAIVRGAVYATGAAHAGWW